MSLNTFVENEIIMAKSNLGQAFVKSLVRQVGRDAGKVVSNKAFGDAHSTPIRMVQSADTSAQFSGKRRSYRHDLDRVVNGDLPSTPASAKKSIVTLENAFIEFANGLMPLGNAHKVEALRNWTDKSLDFIGDVLKIVDKPDVQELAQDLVKTLTDLKAQTKERLAAMEMPKSDGLGQKKKVARIVFWSGMAAALLPGLFVDPSAGGVGAEAMDAGSGVTSIVGFGVLVIIVGIVLLRRSKKARVAHENAITNIEGMKTVAASW